MKMLAGPFKCSSDGVGTSEPIVLTPLTFLPIVPSFRRTQH